MISANKRGESEVVMGGFTYRNLKSDFLHQSREGIDASTDVMCRSGVEDLV